MYIETVPNRNSPPAILLRESYRDGGKVKKRTVDSGAKCNGLMKSGFGRLCQAL
jgi:hypothetical protein